jgi:hypothetical protein
MPEPLSTLFEWVSEMSGDEFIPHPPTWPGYIDNRNGDRDYAEENWNRNYCDACDSSPCQSADNHAGEIAEEEWLNSSSHPAYWSGGYNTDYSGAFPNGEE